MKRRTEQRVCPGRVGCLSRSWREYLLLVLSWTLIPATPLPAAELGNGSNDPRQQHPRIVGGEEALPGEFPWMVALVESDLDPLSGQFCGGALINATWVLTAAHCVDGEVPKSVDVIVGAHKLDSTEGERISLKRIVLHPDYDFETADSDIALLELEVDSLHPQVLLPDPGEKEVVRPGVVATTMGWGITEPGVNDYPVTLRKVSIPVVSNAICNSPEAYDGSVTPRMLCAGLAEGGKDACFGDSGGPLIIPHTFGWELVGVTSWGEGCAEPNKYGVYTRVESFSAWIEMEVSKTTGSNRPPTAEAGISQKAQSGETVVLKGHGNDPEGQPLFFSWRQLSGPKVSLMGADSKSASFVAPEVESVQYLEFELSVSDGESSATDRTGVTVETKNEPPTAHAGSDQAVHKNEMVQLTGTGDDPEGDDLEFSWTQLSGPTVTLMSADHPVAMWRAPGYLKNEQLRFELTVVDTRGGVGKDSVTVTVERNRVPAIETTSPARALGGFEVRLFALGDDPDGDALDYRWRQVNGTPVELNQFDEGAVAFRAPILAVDDYLTFEVKVADGTSASAAVVRVLVPAGRDLVFPSDVEISSAPSEKVFVGAALLNPLDAPSEVSLTSFSSAGDPDFVATLSGLLSPLGQTSFLIDQVIEDSERASAVVLQGDRGPLQGMFLLGTVALTQMDGIGGELQTARSLYFPEVYLGNDKDTHLFLHNPDLNETAEVTVWLYDSFGRTVRETKFQLPARGSVNSSLGAIFDSGEPVLQGYLRVSSDLPLKGWVLCSAPDAFWVVGGQKPLKTDRILVPHFFWAGEGAGTEIHLANLTGAPVAVSIKGVTDSRVAFDSPAIIAEAGELLVIDGAEVFGADALATPASGFLDLHLEVTGPMAIYQKSASVVGCVTFAGAGGRSRAALPVSATGRRQVVFPHLNQSDEENIFTGLVVLNPDAETAAVRLQAYDSKGLPTRTRDFELASMSRVVDLLNGPALFGGDFVQVGGHIRLTSTVPVATALLIGDDGGSFLTAVEGQTGSRAEDAAIVSDIMAN